MKTRILTMARRHYVRPDVPRSTQRHNIRALARAIAILGPQWRLANPKPLTREEITQ